MPSRITHLYDNKGLLFFLVLMIGFILNPAEGKGARRDHPIRPFTDTRPVKAVVQRQWTPLLEADPVIQGVVDEIDWNGLAAKIGWLENFETRYSYTPQCEAAGDSLFEYFSNLGLSVVKRHFIWDDVDMWNVEATQTGTIYPDSIFIICGHYDSISEDAYNLAPGADDNASGTAAVMTAAQILSQHPTNYAIKYVLFAGEEQGLIGSYYYVQDAVSLGMAIVGVLNADMLGWWSSGADFDLEIETNTDSQWLAAAVTNAADLYTNMPYELHIEDNAWWGDHWYFWQAGFAAVNHEESYDLVDPDFNPYYHTTQDVLDHIDPDFTVGNVKILVAALTTLAQLQDATGVTDQFETPSLTLRADPNPFHNGVTICLTTSGKLLAADLGIFNIGGRLIATLPVRLQGGRGTATWRASELSSIHLSSGVYFCRPLGMRSARPIELIYIK